MSKTVAGRIIDVLSEASPERCVRDVRLGLRYVAVQLSNGQCGAAYRFRAERGCEDLSVSVDGPLVNRSAGELLSWLQGVNSLQRSVGLATANALIAKRSHQLIQADILSIINLEPGDKVAMVGHFEPLVATIEEQCSLNIYELDPSLAQGLIPAPEAIEGLKNSDVALITSTSILNDTLDELLEATTGCREIAILGPSTPLLAEAFTDTSATLLSGINIFDVDIIRVVSEGGGMQQFKHCAEKVNYRLSRIRSL